MLLLLPRDRDSLGKEAAGRCRQVIVPANPESSLKHLVRVTVHLSSRLLKDLSREIRWHFSNF